MREAPHQLAGRRFCVGETGGLGALADAIGRALIERRRGRRGAPPPGRVGPGRRGERVRRRGLPRDRRSRAIPAAPPTSTPLRAFESIGGRRLAELAARGPDGAAVHRGAASPPACACPSCGKLACLLCCARSGPPRIVVEHTGELARTLTLAFSRWVESPGGPLTCGFFPQLLPQDVDNVKGRFTRPDSTVASRVGRMRQSVTPCSGRSGLSGRPRW